MNEIPKNTPSIPQQPQKIEQVKPDSIQGIPVPAQEVQTKEINEILENPVGRAGVKADNLENDLKLFVQNPELARKALEVAELAEQKYESAGVKDAELKALAVGRAFVEEFQK